MKQTNYSMESALYGIFTLVGFVSEISLVRCAHSFDFRYFTNSCENPACTCFPWSNLYIIAASLCEKHSYFWPTLWGLGAFICDLTPDLLSKFLSLGMILTEKMQFLGWHRQNRAMFQFVPVSTGLNKHSWKLKTTQKSRCTKPRFPLVFPALF